MSVESAPDLPKPLTPDDIVLVYDGVCGLCNATVQFVLRHDARKKIRFTTLQSPLGESIRSWSGLPPTAEGADPGTMIVVDHGSVYTRSSAALHLARHLNWPFPIAYSAIIIPRVLRDAVYNFIARNRYRWFGKHDSCSLPSADVRERFL